MDAFDTCFAIVVLGTEGGFQNSPADPGNWTGGAVGSGECRGTNLGISAAAYPDCDIAALTPEGAQAIYRPDYWVKAGCDQMVPPLALLVFDAAVNNGVSRSVQWVQLAVGAAEDGAFGPETLRLLREAAQLHGWPHICAEALARRMNFMAQLPNWRTFGLGWARRLANLPWQSMRLEGGG